MFKCPICSEHRPTPKEINGAACHSCVLLPETCCELSNRILDHVEDDYLRIQFTDPTKSFQHDDETLKEGILNLVLK